MFRKPQQMELGSGFTKTKSTPIRVLVWCLIRYQLCHFFHPDCNRRLWIHTRSAVPSLGEGARGLKLSFYHRWGISPRPEVRLR